MPDSTTTEAKLAISPAYEKLSPAPGLKIAILVPIPSSILPRMLVAPPVTSRVSLLPWRVDSQHMALECKDRNTTVEVRMKASGRSSLSFFGVVLCLASLLGRLILTATGVSWVKNELCRFGLDVKWTSLAFYRYTEQLRIA
jgi:hypothetical protein